MLPKLPDDALKNDGGLRIIKLSLPAKVARAADRPDLTLTICLGSR